MKKNLKTYSTWLIWIGLASLTFFSSCKKYIDIKPPIDQLTTTSVFIDSASAEAAIIGLYSQSLKINFLTGGFLYGNTSLYTALSADELVKTTSSPDIDQYGTNSVLPTSTNNTTQWSDAYNLIYQSNIIMESLIASPTLSISLKTRLASEAKFFRGICYFYLTNMYGGVPLVTSSNYKANATLAQSDTIAVYKQIVFDLTDAQAGLSATNTKIRANKLIATALLARVFLYQRDYVNAEKFASMVINSKKYSMSLLDNTFLTNNSEAIFQFAPLAAGKIFATLEGNIFNPGGAAYIPGYYFTQQLLAAFEKGDQRLGKWTGTNIVNGVPYTYPFKYKVSIVLTGAPNTEAQTVLRLAEQYLIRAEALAQQDNLKDAITDLDVVRARAGLSQIALVNPDISKTDLLNMIYHENRIEFFTEWGHRWFDLKRLGQANKVLAPIKGANWKPTAVLYPIPYSEVTTDLNLKQNPGYEFIN